MQKLTPPGHQRGQLSRAATHAGGSPVATVGALGAAAAAAAAAQGGSLMSGTAASTNDSQRTPTEDAQVCSFISANSQLVLMGFARVFVCLQPERSVLGTATTSVLRTVVLEFTVTDSGIGQLALFLCLFLTSFTVCARRHPRAVAVVAVHAVRSAHSGRASPARYFILILPRPHGLRSLA